jgi:hypothetical protein
VRLIFEPLIESATWIALASLAAVGMTWYGLRRPRGYSGKRWSLILLLMSLCIGSVLVVLLNPIWVEPLPNPLGKPVLTVVVDDTLSMATKDVPLSDPSALKGASTTRFQAALEAAQAFDSIREKFDVRVVLFSDTSVSRSSAELTSADGVSPNGSKTDINQVIASVLREDYPAGHGLVVCSDGTHNAAGGVADLIETAKTAKAMAVPIFTQTYGGQTTVDDLQLDLSRSQELSFINQTLVVTANVRQHGALVDRVKLTVKREGETVFSETVEVGPDRSVTTSVPLQERKVGLHRYDVSIEPVEGEVTTANNQATLVVRVVDEPIRVLMLEGKPYWDAKFLVRTLSADLAVELDCVVRVSNNRYFKRQMRVTSEDAQPADGSPVENAAETPAETPAASTAESTAAADGEPAVLRRTESVVILQSPAELLDREKGLGEYQVIVLGRDAESFLTEEMVDAIRSWVATDGGSLVCYRGAPVAQAGESLNRLFPVRWTPTPESRFRVELTEAGRDLGWLVAPSDGQNLEMLPSLSRVATVEGMKPMTVVLAKGDGEHGTPVLTYQPYGTGRAVVVEGAGMWRWAFLPPEYQGHDQVYASLWQSLLRWLVASLGLTPGQDLALHSDRVTYTEGEAVYASLLTRSEFDADSLPNVQLLDEQNQLISTIQPLPMGEEPGVYRVPFGQLGEGRYRARVGENDSAAVVFDVRPYYGERLEVSARPDLMQKISEVSEGQAFGQVEPGDAVATSIAASFQAHLKKTRPERMRRRIAWDRWWVLVGIVVLWGTSWGVRRSGGLI